MTSRVKIFFLLTMPMIISAGENMSSLLSQYKSEAELSRITKSESAGFVDIYTREDIEKMQAYTLGDILKQFTIPFISRTAQNITFYTKPSNKSMPFYSIRIYINDHDFSTSSYGSDAVLLSSMSLDYIDHIVVYKSTSSVEFGNEPSTVVIKLYTKKAEKEEGGKLKISTDQKGSYHASTYFAHTVKDNFSYFFYANKNDINRKKYYKDDFELDSDEYSDNLYANLFYKDWRIEIGHYQKQLNSFLGMGKEAHPHGDGLDSDHDFIHVQKKFDNNLKVQLSYDHILYDLDYKDDSGIDAGNFGIVSNYAMNYDDYIVSGIVEKTIENGKNKLLLGSFIKQKKSESYGEFDAKITEFDNTLNLYSIYAEDSYSFNQSTMFVSSLKYDFYRYDKEVKSQDKYIARAGIIKNINKFQLKAFYTKTYYPIPMSYLYSTDNAPYKTDPNLDYPEPTLITLGVRYKDKKHEVDTRVALIDLKNRPIYNGDGYKIISKKYDQYEVKYSYKLNRHHKLSFDIYTGKNSYGAEYSSPNGADLILFNTFGKFDIFNQLSYKSAYTLYDVDVDDSYDYNFAVKYHVNPDFSIGIKGENVFNSGFEQAYKSIGDSIPIYDQKFWLSMEYLF